MWYHKAARRYFKKCVEKVSVGNQLAIVKESLHIIHLEILLWKGLEDFYILFFTFLYSEYIVGSYINLTAFRIDK